MTTKKQDCCVCLEAMTNPKAFDCSHVVCGKCFPKIERCCPLCHRRHRRHHHHHHQCLVNHRCLITASELFSTTQFHIRPKMLPFLKCRPRNDWKKKGHIYSLTKTQGSTYDNQTHLTTWSLSVTRTRACMGSASINCSFKARPSTSTAHRQLSPFPFSRLASIVS